GAGSGRRESASLTGTIELGQSSSWRSDRTGLRDCSVARFVSAAYDPGINRATGSEAGRLRVPERTPADPEPAGVRRTGAQFFPEGTEKMSDTLHTTLRKLRLSGLLATLDVRLQEAASHGLNHQEFLELILQDELLVRSDRTIARRVKAASFRELRTLEDFEWAFN